MNSVGSWYDNAPMESFLDTLKIEWIHYTVHAIRAQAQVAVFCYVQAFYSRQRRHLALDHMCPQAYEQDCSRRA